MWGQGELRQAPGGWAYIAATATLLPGVVVRRAGENLVDSLDACADSCRMHPNCSGVCMCARVVCVCVVVVVVGGLGGGGGEEAWRVWGNRARAVASHVP